MAELTDEQLQRQNDVDSAIHGLFQELFGFGVPWDIEKIARVREAIQDAYGMTEEQRFAFYPWVPDNTDFQEPTGEPRVASDDDRHECANCGARYLTSSLNTIRDYHERVEPGEVVPSGECPDCGALCYPLPKYPDHIEPG